jgi:DNA (cytosine-5)-methyltransferase 1
MISFLMMEKEKKKKKPLKVIELFAGVGGFRVALENINRKNKNELFRVIWSNQWEPSTKTQHASEVYVKRFGEKGHSNLDIAKVSISEIPDHDLLVGGFPCQDYSVARTLSQAAGVHGFNCRHLGEVC